LSDVGVPFRYSTEVDITVGRKSYIASTKDLTLFRWIKIINSRHVPVSRLLTKKTHCCWLISRDRQWHQTTIRA